jgi:6-pyruvoyltetrahydropterin/6-carboxytetrahydropterin synthase
MSFEVGASRPLRALHRLPWGSEEERQPHAHDYRIDVVVERDGLDERGVVCDLDILGEALDGVVARLQDRDLDEVLEPDERGVTVELLARWLHGELAEPVRRAGGEALGVRVWEAPDAFGGYRGPVGAAPPSSSS